MRPLVEQEVNRGEIGNKTHPICKGLIVARPWQCWAFRVECAAEIGVPLWRRGFIAPGIANGAL